MTKRSQHGFTLIEVLLSILVVTALTATGYYIYNNQNKETEDTATTEVAAEGQSTQAKYLSIKELGLKIKLNDKLTGLEYLPPDSSESQTVAFTQEQFTSLVEACRAENSPFEKPIVLGSLTKYAGTYDEDSMPDDIYTTTRQQFTGFYVEYGTPDGGYCDDATSAQAKKVDAKFTELNDELKKAISAAEQI